MVSWNLRQLVQEMHATLFASLSTHEQSIYTRIEDGASHTAILFLLVQLCDTLSIFLASLLRLLPSHFTSGMD